MFAPGETEVYGIAAPSGEAWRDEGVPVKTYPVTVSRDDAYLLIDLRSLDQAVTPAGGCLRYVVHEARSAGQPR